MQQDNQLAPLPENPMPQDFGFPANPSSAEAQRWYRQELWLQALAETGSVGAACHDSRIPPSTIENWDLVDVWGFKKRRAWAIQRFLGRVEAELNSRVFEGYEKPLQYKGQLTRDDEGNVVTIRVKEPTDLYFMAKKHDPSYKDNYQPQTVQDNRSVTIINNYPSGPRQLGTKPLGHVVPEQPDSVESLPPESATDTDSS